MEEDVLGPREEAVGDRYTTCTACGRLWPREGTTLADGEPPEGTLSEQAELCPECRRKRELGEENVRPAA